MFNNKVEVTGPSNDLDEICAHLKGDVQIVKTINPSEAHQMTEQFQVSNGRGFLTKFGATSLTISFNGDKISFAEFITQRFPNVVVV